MKTKFVVIGAGVGGLSAAAYLKQQNENDFIVIEKGKSVPNNLTNGLHYLHDIDFSLPFPMDFKKCMLTENIWNTKTNEFSKAAMLPDLFAYSKKVMDNLRHPSSIMDPGKRSEVYVPESNDMNELIEGFESYIGAEHFLFDRTVNAIDAENKLIGIGDQVINYEYLITTAPLNTFSALSGKNIDYSFKHKPLYITNYTSKNIVPNWMIVLYMSDEKFPPYRISCFNNVISMESLRELSHDDEVIVKYIIGDLFDYDLSSGHKYTWETGRIFGFSKIQRKELLEELAPKGVFPIGRFGIWDGKIRMDDTIRQAHRIVSNLSFRDNQPLEVLYQNSI